MESEVSDFFEKIFTEIINNVKDPNQLTGKSGISVILLMILILLEWFFKKFWRKIIANIKLLNVVNTLTHFVLRFFFLISLLGLWLNALDALIILLVFIGVIISLSIKGLISNLAGWFLIVNKHHFRIYDRIEIDTIKGEVISVGLLYFTLMEISNWFEAEAPTGRTIKIPNSKILTTAVYNYNDVTPFVWKEICYLLAFESDWQKAQKIITDILLTYYQNFEKEYLADSLYKEVVLKQLQLFDGELKPVQIVDVNENGVLLKTRYVVYYTKGTTVATKLHQEILSALQDAAIQMAGKRMYFIKNNESVS